MSTTELPDAPATAHEVEAPEATTAEQGFQGTFRPLASGTPPAATPVEPADEALDWAPYGRGPHDSLTVETDPRGHAVLRLAVVSTRPAIHDARAAVTEYEARLRGRALDLLQQAPEFAHLVALRPQYRAAAEAAKEAEHQLQKARDRQAALSKMTPPPQGLASRLVKAESDLEQAAAEVTARAAELAALEPVYRKAERDVRQALPELCRQAHVEGHREAQGELAEALRGLAEAQRAVWTRLLRLRRGRDGHAPDPGRLADIVINSPDDAGE